jgi:hypothetical protein
MGCVCTPGAGPPTYTRWAGPSPQNRSPKLHAFNGYGIREKSHKALFIEMAKS